MRARGIPARAIIFNHYEKGNPLHEDNRAMCEYMTGLKTAACVRDGDEDLEIPFDRLESLYAER